MNDYTGFKDYIGENNVLAELRNLSLDYKKAETELALKEEELKVAKENLRVIAEEKIPEIMDANGIPSFTTEDGAKISVEEKIRCSISGDRAPAALKWLEENDYGNIIKREFKIQFGKDEEAWAKEFEAELKQKDLALHTKTNRTVHNSTLQSFIRQQLEEGVDIPLELFGVFRQRIAKVKI